MRTFTYTLLAMLCSLSVFAADVPFQGTISFPNQTAPAPTSKSLKLPEKPAPYRASEPTFGYFSQSRFRGGVEIGGGAYPGISNVGPIGGIGLLGDYKLDRRWGLEGRLFFSQYTLSGPYYYSGWPGWNGNWPGWYRSYYPAYQGYGANTVNYNQTDFTFGPTYRILRGRFSPVLGALLGYSHRYYDVPGSYEYGGYTGSSDELALGGQIGLEYQLAKELSVGADLRYMVPVGYSGTSSYYPATSQPVEGLNYYVETLNLKFSF